MTPDPSGEVLRQVRLRYLLTAHAAGAYCAAGFSIVVKDCYFGAEAMALLRAIRSRPLHLTTLN